MTPDQIATLSAPDLDAAVIEKCKELREVEGWATAGPWQSAPDFPGVVETLDQRTICGTGSTWGARKTKAHAELIVSARNSFLAHLDAVEALAGWKCGRCEGTGERTMCGSGQLLPCPSCAPIVTIKREWLGKMMEVGNEKG